MGKVLRKPISKTRETEAAREVTYKAIREGKVN